MQLEVAVHGTEDFEGSELPSGYCHDECPLLYSCPSNTKNEPQCKLWTLHDHAVSVLVTSGNNCTTAVEDVDDEEGYNCAGEDGIRSSYLPSRFALNLMLTY